MIKGHNKDYIDLKQQTNEITLIKTLAARYICWAFEMHTRDSNRIGIGFEFRVTSINGVKYIDSFILTSSGGTNFSIQTLRLELISPKY